MQANEHRCQFILSANAGGFYRYPCIADDYYDVRYEVCGKAAKNSVDGGDHLLWLCWEHYTAWVNHAEQDVWTDGSQDAVDR
jgi:hypothetical protein